MDEERMQVIFAIGVLFGGIYLMTHGWPVFGVLLIFFIF